MFELIVALLTVLSVGIFAAHAVDAVRSRKKEASCGESVAEHFGGWV
jgi:hypothetical protein